MRKFKGGGRSSAPSQQTVVQTNLPEYAEPYFTRLLGRAEGCLLYTSPSPRDGW